MVARFYRNLLTWTVKHCTTEILVLHSVWRHPEVEVEEQGSDGDQAYCEAVRCDLELHNTFSSSKYTQILCWRFVIWI